MLSKLEQIKPELSKLKKVFQIQETFNLSFLKNFGKSNLCFWAFQIHEKSNLDFWNSRKTKPELLKFKINQTRAFQNLKFKKKSYLKYNIINHVCFWKSKIKPELLKFEKKSNLSFWNSRKTNFNFWAFWIQEKSNLCFWAILICAFET